MYPARATTVRTPALIATLNELIELKPKVVVPYLSKYIVAILKRTQILKQALILCLSEQFHAFRLTPPRQSKCILL